MSFIPTNKVLSQVTGTVSTTDNTVTTVVQIPTYANTGVVISAEIIGTRTGGSAGAENDMIIVRFLSEYKNINDTVTLFGTPEKYSNKDNSNCDVNLVISGDNINVRVTGDTNNNYDWSAKATFFALSMGTASVPSAFSAQFAHPEIATPSGTITFGTPSNGDTIIFTNLPQNATTTYTKDDSTDFDTTFSTISELTNLITNFNDITATDNGTDVSIQAYTFGEAMNSVTITGTGSYSSLNITFSGGVNALLTATDPVDMRLTESDTFIIGFWIVVTDYTNPIGLFIKRDAGWSYGDSYAMSLNTNGDINTRTRVAPAGAQGWGSGNIPLNTPTFVAYWLDAPNKQIHISVNGGAPDTFNHGGSGTFTTGAGDFIIGSQGPTAGGLGDYFPGRIDEFFFCKNPPDLTTAINTINSTIYNGGAGSRYFDLSGATKNALGLVHWWTMDEASGTRADVHDSVNLTPNAYISQGAPIVPVTPPAFSARNPANSGNWLDGGVQASLRAMQTDSILLAGWVTLKDANEGYVLACGDDYNGNGADYGLYISAGSGVISWGINRDGTNEDLIDSTPLTVDVPSFVFAWYNSATGDFGIQVDNGTTNTNNTTRTTDPSGSGLFNMFANGVGDGSIGGNLILDEWFLCKNPANMATAISTIQNSIYNGGSGKRYRDVSSGDKTAMGLVSWWTLDDATDVTRIDAHGSNDLTNNGDIQQTDPIVPIFMTPPPFAAATSPDSANFLLATNPTDLRANSTDTMIFGYWLNVNNINNNGIAWKTDPNTSSYNYYLSTEGSGKPELLFLVNDNGSSAQIDSSATLIAGSDNFVLCWIDPATTTLNIQVNGGSVDSYDYSGVAAPFTAGAGDFYVCKSADNNLLLDGKIDDFFVCKNPSNLATAISTIQTSIFNSATGKRYYDLTPTEKTDIGLVSWWGMDEATNTTRMDLHGSNHLANNGTVSQAAPIIPEPFNPTHISGLTGWFRGSSIGVGNGGNVSTWFDESGNQNDASQATTANKPVFRATGGANSLPCVEFNMSSNPQFLTIAGISPTFDGSPSNFTFFVVSALTDVALDNFNYTILSATRNTNNAVYEQFTVSDTPEYVYRESDDPGTHGGAVVSGDPVVADTFEIFTVAADNAAATFYRGGVSAGTTTARASGGGRTYSPNQVSIGADRRFGVQDGANAKVSEVIIYDSPLSSTDLNQVGNYLATKYGLSWTNI